MFPLVFLVREERRVPHISYPALFGKLLSMAPRALLRRWFPGPAGLSAAGQAGTIAVRMQEDLAFTIPPIRRARGYRLYDHRGRRYLDLWQNGGHSLLGHRGLHCSCPC